MNAKQVHGSRIPSAGRICIRLPALLLCALPFASAASAETATATVSATISGGGSVGDAPTVTPTPTPTPVSTGSTPNTSTVNGGGASSQSAAVEQSGVTTFRPLPSVGPAASGEGGGAAETGGEDTTTSSGGPAAGPAAAAASGPRLPQGARPIGNIAGGLSSVAVTGSPNQTYGISLPGQTTIVQGSETMNIEGFVHNAGDTPAMDGAGRSSFNVGAKVGSDGAAATTGGEGAGAAAAGTGSVPANFQGPVITTEPFMDVIISYN